MAAQVVEPVIINKLQSKLSYMVSMYLLGTDHMGGGLKGTGKMDHDEGEIALEWSGWCRDRDELED